MSGKGEDRSGNEGPARARPPIVRRGGRLSTEVDATILAALMRDARTPNNAIAAEVGIAPSTCLGRIRAMENTGVILGYHADVDPAALGLGLQAMIMVRLRAGARHRLRAFSERLRTRPEVRDLYFLGGADDFMIHLAVTDTGALRDFVLDQLSGDPEVAATHTNIIFEHVRGHAIG